MSARIVVTGFEPWEHGTENPTLDVLDLLDRANDIAGELSTVRLPVDSARLAGIVEETLDRVRPNLWISLGLAPGSAVIAVERIAGNVLDFPVPDNAGHQPGGDPVFAEGPPAYFSTLPIKTIAFGLRAAGIPAKISNSASTYGCNQMMYTALHLIARRGFPTRAGFIHVPASPSLAAKQAYPLIDMPSMDVGLMSSAVRKAIALTLATDADTDLREPAFNY
jgi:pyroglutamyl-peptidase